MMDISNKIPAPQPSAKRLVTHIQEPSEDDIEWHKALVDEIEI